MGTQTLDYLPEDVKRDLDDMVSRGEAKTPEDAIVATFRMVRQKRTDAEQRLLAPRIADDAAGRYSDRDGKQILADAAKKHQAE